MAAAHTFLKKNPNDPYLTKNMKYYKTLLDVDEYLIDHEEQPYEVRTSNRRRSSPASTLKPTGLSVPQSVFLKSVMLYNSGDFSGSARNMEQAVTQFLEIHSSCLAGCESAYEIVEFKDFYPTLAGERWTASSPHGSDEKHHKCVLLTFSPLFLPSPQTSTRTR